MLVSLLMSRTLRCRTGILLVPHNKLGQEANIAARSGVELVDYSQCILASLPAGTAYVDINGASEFARLNRLATKRGGADCLLIANFDLALAKLGWLERQSLWSAIFEKLSNRDKALMIAMPEEAENLLPSADNLDRWKQTGRIAAVPDNLD
jgi:hypothetical protein